MRIAKEQVENAINNRVNLQKLCGYWDLRYPEQMAVLDHVIKGLQKDSTADLATLVREWHLL